MATFTPYGPFALPVEKLKHGRRIHRKLLEGFWGHNNCGSDVGVYVFTLTVQHGAAYPYYVGSTKRSFDSECFQPHKIEKFNEVLASYHGAPKMYFLALDGKYNAKAIKSLEIAMIGIGMERNPGMRNVMHTKKDQISVTDVLGARRTKGAGLKAAREFRSAMGIERHK